MCVTSVMMAASPIASKNEGLLVAKMHNTASLIDSVPITSQMFQQEPESIELDDRSKELDPPMSPV